MMPAEKKTLTLTIPRANIWMIFTIILAILLVVALFKGWSITGLSTGVSGGLSSQEAANKTIDYINGNLVTTGSVSLVSVEEFSGLYKVTTSYQGQQIPVYVTKDGKFILSLMADTSQEIPEEEQQTETTPKTDKPSVELFVMSFCPYGIQAEDLMKPVVDLLGSKADIKVHFIVNIGGTTPDTVQSLHGATEAQEDLRQICIMKYYDQKTYWDYLMTINANCSSLYRDATAFDTCWKNAATQAGIDTAKIDTCSKGSEGMTLLKADEQLTGQYGVSGSPTLIINGVTYSGARSSDAFKEAICSAFTTAPSECSQALSASSGTASSGGCAQ
jgi:protein-disulfide isomerase